MDTRIESEYDGGRNAGYRNDGTSTSGGMGGFGRYYHRIEIRCYKMDHPYGIQMGRVRLLSGSTD